MNKKLICSVFALIAINSGSRADETINEPIQPIPETISPGARAYYENLQPRPAGSVDVENPKALAFMRQFLGKIFLANAEQLGIEYELEPAAIEGVEAYWIRNSQSVSDKALNIPAWWRVYSRLGQDERRTARAHQPVFPDSRFVSRISPGARA